MSSAVRWKRLLAALALALCLVSCAATEEPTFEGVEQVHEAEGATLRLTLDRLTLTTVDSLVLTIEVEAAESDEIEFPTPDSEFGEFESVGDEAIPARLGEDGRVTRSHRYELEPFLPGEFEFPALTVVLNGSAEITTEPMTITVTSVLDDPEAAELRDIGGPMDVPVPWWWWALGGLAIVAAIVGFLWWRKRKREATPPPPPTPPHEIALAALRALLAEDLPGKGQVKPFYMRLSDILRHYIEGQFGLRAPEQTTEEFLEAMRNSHAIERAHKDLLRNFLKHVDMVKFAELTPDADEIDRTAESAREFIEQTIPKVEPWREEAGASAAPRTQA